MCQVSILCLCGTLADCDFALSFLCHISLGECEGGLVEFWLTVDEYCAVVKSFQNILLPSFVSTLPQSLSCTF